MAAEGHDDQGIPFYLHQMPTVTTGLDGPGVSPPNGELEGDVSYLTVVVPDLNVAYTFYGGVFGWSFDQGGAVGGVAPQIGMTTRPPAGLGQPGAILCYRVNDIAAAVARIRRAGGRAQEVQRRPYGLESLATDDQGTPFYLHQF